MGLLLFNWIGYRLFSSYMEGRSNADLEAQLDENGYDQSELISIKLPADHLGYYINSSQFERVDGQIEIAGVQYNYVKKRLYNDSLELLCIPNHGAMQLNTARDEFFKLVNDLQQQGQQSKKSGSHPGSSKNFSVDSYTANQLFNIQNAGFTTIAQSYFYLVQFSSFYAPTAEQPPERC